MQFETRRTWEKQGRKIDGENINVFGFKDQQSEIQVPGIRTRSAGTRTRLSTTN
jgi:hypothetical protein